LPFPDVSSVVLSLSFARQSHIFYVWQVVIVPRYMILYLALSKLVLSKSMKIVSDLDHSLGLSSSIKYLLCGQSVLLAKLILNSTSKNTECCKTCHWYAQSPTGRYGGPQLCGNILFQWWIPLFTEISQPARKARYFFL